MLIIQMLFPNKYMAPSENALTTKDIWLPAGAVLIEKLVMLHLSCSGQQ